MLFAAVHESAFGVPIPDSCTAANWTFIWLRRLKYLSAKPPPSNIQINIKFVISASSVF